MFLDRFKKAKFPEIACLQTQEQEGTLLAPYAGKRPCFISALQHPMHGKPLAVISEFKQASPSRGIICKDLSPEDVAVQYKQAGADCLSVLTEEEFFGGDISFLDRMAQAELPMLRKDFIFHPLQVTLTASTPASAMLLIVRLTPDIHELRELRELAESHGIHSVVEVFDEADLALARASGARIIQVNARDLDTLNVDRNMCLQLGSLKQQGETWIAASGIETTEHIEQAASMGYDAVLIGSALMENGTPGNALSALLRPISASSHPCTR